MKTILYVGSFEMPDKNAAANRVLGIAKILAENDYNVIFAGISKENSPSSCCGFPSFPRSYPKTVRQWFHYLFNVDWYISLIEKYDVDIVIAYNPHLGVAKKLRSYCKKQNIKYICDLTEWQENKFSFKPIRFIKWLDTAITMRLENKKADGIVAISDYLASYYRKNKIVMIPPLVDVKDKKWNSSVPFVKHDILNYIYTGKSGQAKDRLDLIIDALSSLPADYKFVFRIVGLDYGSFLKSYKRPSNFVLDKTRIQFFGSKTHEECIALLNSSDCTFVIRETTRKNNAGFSTKYVEAITSGCYVICTDVSNIKDYTNDKVVLIDTVSVESIRKAVLSLFETITQDREKCLSKSILFDYHLYSERLLLFLKTL